MSMSPNYENFIDENMDYRELFLTLACEDIEERNKVLNPKNSYDLLLRMRADIITDHTRLYRVGLNRVRKSGKSMLNDPFKQDFQIYMSYLDEIDKMIVEDIPSGYILDVIPEAQCMKTEFGNIIIISEALRYFIYYFSLSMISFDIPIEIRIQAALIAIRVMLEKETMDFELDPRGIVPEEIDCAVKEITDAQIQFIIGHEYAHHRLAHEFSDTVKISRSMGEIEEYINIYNHAWKNEFEADLGSINAATDIQKKNELIHGSIHFFWRYILLKK